MERFLFPKTAQTLGQLFDAEVIGEGGLQVTRLDSLEMAGEGSLSFINNRKYFDFLGRLKNVVLFTPRELVRPELPITYLVVKNPQLAFSKIAAEFKPQFNWYGVSELSSVHPSVEFGDDVAVGPFCVLGRGVKIGSGSRISPFVYLGEDVEIGEDCEIFPQAVLLAGVRLGNRVKVCPGAILGSEGFGFFPTEDKAGLVEMPQIGNVIVGDDVRIGANNTIDRATLGDTRIGAGTKMDDQVHIAHNVKVGRNCILCGQVGIAGSTKIGDNVMLAGQVGVADGLEIGNGVKVGAASAVLSDLKEEESYFLSPAQPLKSALKIVRYLKKLPEMAERLRRLESIIEKEK